AERAIDNVSLQVSRVSELMASISTASTEQNSGINQINTAIAEMDHVTQQNASKVQSIAASAENLSHEAFELANVVDAFRLEGAQDENIQSAREKLHRATQALKKETQELPAPNRQRVNSPAPSNTGEQWNEF
ncbi:MAG: chemotaxis protein, partial [Gammaproteobacteria bacterium]|nr:chemotaxis protein [Gammaproteobacteria bacterium]